MRFLCHNSGKRSEGCEMEAKGEKFVCKPTKKTGNLLNFEDK